MGHVFRKSAPYEHDSDAIKKNMKRLAAVWTDEFCPLFFAAGTLGSQNLCIHISNICVAFQFCVPEFVGLVWLIPGCEPGQHMTRFWDCEPKHQASKIQCFADFMLLTQDLDSVIYLI